MFGSVVLDVAIGMAFVYLLLSLIASVIQEILSTFMQLRPANLVRGIRSLFSNEAIGGKDLTNAIYSHGLVCGLYGHPAEDKDFRKGPWQTRVIDPVRIWMRNRFGYRLGDLTDIDTGAKIDMILLPAYIPCNIFSSALIDILNPSGQTGDAIVASIEANLHAASAAGGRVGKASQALLTMAINAEGDLKTFQASIEGWYNDSMDRVSAWYKRSTQKILIMLGLLLAVALNVDTVKVARTLWVDRDVRAAMVAQAQAFTTKNQTLPPAGASVQDLSGAASDFQQAISATLLPVGWKQTFTQEVRYARCHETDALVRLCGWILTALAISLGAPFWFDTLNKFMVVRSTVKPQEKSAVEASKDASS